MRERSGLEHELSALLAGRIESPVARSDREVVHDPDQRTEIADTIRPPFRWICYLDITYPDPGQRYEEAHQAGTGVLIGPRHVLTAAHSLLSDDGRLKAVRVAVTPGRGGSRKPFGTYDAKKWDIHPFWVRKGRSDRQFDYALITLKDAIGTKAFKALGNKPLGYWGDPKWGAGTRRDVLDPAGLGGSIVNVAGYPGDRPTGTLWMGTGAIRGPMAPGRRGEILATDRLALHAVDTEKGQSGAPVWVWYPKTGARRLVGIHIGPAAAFTIDERGNQRPSHNYAVRLNDDMRRQLDAWT